MLTRNSSYVVAAIVALGVGGAEIASAQDGREGVAQRVQLEAPLQLSSLEWWVASNDVVVRGVVVDVAADKGNWNIVTLDVAETLKGAKAERVKFAVHKGKADAALAQAKESKAEMLWVLKSQKAGVPGEAPDREVALARHKIDLHAPFVPGRPGEPTLPSVPLGQKDAGVKFLTLELKLLQSSDELVKAIRTAIAETADVCPCEAEALRSYVVALPKEIAERTGFSRSQNHLVAPVDRRLEELARRLVLTPATFFPGEASNTGQLSERQMLRLEGIKALRLFPSEKNLAITRLWLDAPTTAANFKSDADVNLVPTHARISHADKFVLPTELARVPEVHFQQPLTKAMSTADAQLHTAITIDGVNLLNQKKTDAYIETLMKNRPDLAGLPFVMGDKCRMKGETGRKFAAALDVFRKAEAVILSANPQPTTGTIPLYDNRLMGQYKNQMKDKQIDPSASVSSLMQVLGHEDGTTRRDLVEYLDGIPGADATRSLARLAVFSTEAEVRGAALKSLKMRRDQDYTDVLLTGLNYPWPAVAQNASEAIVALGRNDLIPQLIDVLDTPDPRAPQVQETGGKKVTVVRELVRLNHHHNCLLCHAPAPKDAKAEAGNLEGLTAQVPVPSESMVAYYRPSVPDILVRFDVTYLRQDFSMKLPVANADPWPELQRYDFLVRVREVSDKEARAYQELLGASRPEASPYRRAAHAALRELTGNDVVEPSAAAWRKSVGS